MSVSVRIWQAVPGVAVGRRVLHVRERAVLRRREQLVQHDAARPPAARSVQWFEDEDGGRKQQETQL